MRRVVAIFREKVRQRTGGYSALRHTLFTIGFDPPHTSREGPDGREPVGTT